MRFTVLACLLVPIGLQAQSGATPPDWRWRTDEPARLVAEQTVPDSAWRFEAMPPGWHVTTGPGVTIYHPDARAEGRFALEARIALFPDPSAEGYGLFLAGADLDAASPVWLAVLLRRDGAVTVQRRRGSATIVLHPWTPADSAKAHSGKGVVTNTLRVSVEPDSLRIDVNGSRAAALARPAGILDGAFGFRIGSGLNLHVTTLSHTRQLAPPPSQP